MDLLPQPSQHHPELAALSPQSRVLSAQMKAPKLERGGRSQQLRLPVLGTKDAPKMKQGYDARQTQGANLNQE